MTRARKTWRRAAPRVSWVDPRREETLRKIDEVFATRVTVQARHLVRYGYASPSSMLLAWHRLGLVVRVGRGLYVRAEGSR